MADPRTVLNDPPSRFFAALGDVCVRRRSWVIAATLLLLAGSVFVSLARTEIDTSIEKFADEDDDAHAVLDAYRDAFGRDEMFFIVAVGDVFSRPFLERLAALQREAAALDLDLDSLGRRGKQGGLVRERLFALDSPINTFIARVAPPADDDDADDIPDDSPAPAEPPDDAPGDDGFGDFTGAGDDGFGDFDAPAADTADAWGDEAGGSLVEQSISLINVRQTRPAGGGIEVGKLMDPLPDGAALPALKARVLADETLVGQVVGADGRHAAIALRTAFMSEGDSARVYEALLEVVDRHRAEGFELHVSGVPALNAGLTDTLMADLIRLVQLSAVAMFLIMGYLFRHPLAVMAPLFLVGLSAVTTAAAMGLWGMPLTMMSNVLPAFLFCVGIGHSVHIISVYRDALRWGLSNDDAVRYSIASTGRPVLFTSLTTMVGLASFIFASLEVIGEMGLSGAFGVFVAFVLSVTFLPACLTLNRRGHMMGAKPMGEQDGIDRFLAWCLRLSGRSDDPGVGVEIAADGRKRRRNLVVMVMLIGVALFGGSLMKLYHNPLVWLPEETPMRVAFDLMDQKVGGTGNVQLLIEGGEQGLKDVELMRGLEGLRAHIKAFEHPEYGPIVGNAVGILDVIKETRRALKGGADAEYRLPETDRGVSDMLFLFESSGPDELERLATADLKRAQETIRVPWLEATRYQPLVDHIEAGIAAHVPEGAQVQATGSIYTLVSTVGNLIRDLVASFGAAFAIITLIMMLLLGSVRLGLIAMVPNLMPIVMIGGVMGFSEIPIDMNNLLIASISIGVAVDDTIHLLHHWRVNMQRNGGNVEEALRQAMRHSGRAMVSTTLILLIGFSVYLGATMYNIQRFGFLVGLTAVMALLIDLIFAPALLRTFYDRPSAETEAST